MSLLIQIRTFLGLIAITMFLLAFYSGFNRLFYVWHGKIKRLLLEVPLFLAYAYIYFRFLVYTCQCQLRLHFLLAIFIGFYVYEKFYAIYINLYLEKAAIIIKNHLFLPFQKRLKRIYDIMKTTRSKRRKRNEKRSAKQTSD